MADIDEPQAGQGVDELVAVDILDPNAFALNQDALAGVMRQRAIGRGVHEQMLGPGFLEGCFVG